MTTTESGYAPIDGASIYYESCGSGPALVLVHGFSFDASMWDDQLPSFSEQFRVLRYDLRGFGRSTSSEVPYTHAGDLKALLDYLKIDSACLVGLSLGGGAVINFALMYPDIARALVLVAPSLGGFRWSPEAARAQESLRTIVRKEGVEKARRVWIRQMTFRHAMKKPAVATKLRTMVEQYSGWHWMHTDLGKPLDPPASERLGEIKVPTLVMIGNADAADQVSIADTLEQKIVGAKKVVLPNVGHLINLEEPSAFNDIVLEFLKQVDNC